MRTNIEHAFQKALERVKEMDLNWEQTFNETRAKYLERYPDTTEEWIARLALIHTMLAVDGYVTYKSDNEEGLSFQLDFDHGS